MRNSRGFLIAVLAATGCCGCREQLPEVDAVRPVKAKQVADISAFSERPFSGRAQATQEINLAFEVPGQLIERPVDVGTEVRQGQLLARLDPRDYQNNVDAATARQAQALAYRDRIAQAVASGAVSQQDLTDAEAQLDVAKANVKIAAKALEDTHILAPFDGIVAATYVENFQNVLAKQKIVRLLDLSRVEMWIDIPESLISLAPYVASIEVTFDAFPGRRIEARIKELGTEASERTRTYPVNLIMDQPEDLQILPGMAGRARGTVELPPDAARVGYEIPLSAMFSEDGETHSVWVIEEPGKTVRKVDVTVAEMTPAGVKVRGLSKDQWIVTAGVHFLVEGQAVKIFDEREFWSDRGAGQ